MKTEKMFSRSLAQTTPASLFFQQCTQLQKQLHSTYSKSRSSNGWFQQEQQRTATHLISSDAHASQMLNQLLLLQTSISKSRTWTISNLLSLLIQPCHMLKCDCIAKIYVTQVNILTLGNISNSIQRNLVRRSLWLRISPSSVEDYPNIILPE